MTAVPDTPTSPCCAAAHQYAARGWRVLPIKPGTKRPIPNRWQQLSTTNPDQIDRWWRDHPDAGVGIATGQGLCVIDIDDHDTDGWAAWANLCDQHGQDPVPDTVIACTGGGGHHLLYHVPAGTKISNGAATRLPAGIDVRGDGGQIVAPPTIHTSGAAYGWAEGHSPDETTVADMPQWLLDLLAGPTAPGTPRGAPGATAAATTPRIDAQTPEDRPGDRWATATTWDALLSAAGAHIGPPDREGRRPVTRPGKHPNEGTSATLWTGSDTLKVFTTNWPGLAPEETYSKFGFYAATRHQGDHSAAAAAINQANGWTPPHIDPASLVGATLTTGASGPSTGPAPSAGTPDDTDNGWTQPADLHSILNGRLEPAQPDILPIANGPGRIFYTGRLNTLIGDSETLKTWTALIAALTELQQAHNVWWIDGEDTAATAASRLRALGATDQQLIDHFRWWGPDSAPTPLQWQHLQEAHFVNDQPTLIVIDSFEELAGWYGIDTWRGEQITTVHRQWRQISHLGAAIIFIDHQPKTKDNASRWASGSQRKISGIDGVAITQELISPFGHGRRGIAKLTVGKDRPGGVRAQCADGRTIGLLDMESFPDGSITWTLAPDTTNPKTSDGQGTFLPTRVMGKVAEALSANPPGYTLNALAEKVGGRKATVVLAVEELERTGHVRRSQIGRKHVLQLVKDWPEDD